MSAVTLTFLAIGGLSLLLLLLSLRGHRIRHFHHLQRLLHRLRPRRRSRTYALPVFSGFLGAFGFGGAIASELSPLRGGAAVLFAATVGILAGVPFAWLAGRFVAAVTDMPTDATPHSADLVGATGVVISEVPEGGLGQVRVSFAGQPMKFNARSASPLALGARILVIGVTTPARYRVEQEAEAERNAAVFRADASRQATIATAQAEAERARLAGKGERARRGANAEALRLEGAAQADTVRFEGAAQADAVLAVGQAEAAAMRAKAEAFTQYGEAAVLDLLVRVLPQVVETAARPIGEIDSMTVISTDGASALTKSVASNVAQGLQLGTDLTGIDLRALLSRLATQDRAA